MKAVYYFGKGKVPCKGFVPEKSFRNEKKSLCAGKSPLQSVNQSQKIPVKTLQVIRFRREKSLRLDGSDWLTKGHLFGCTMILPIFAAGIQRKKLHSDFELSCFH